MSAFDPIGKHVVTTETWNPVLATPMAEITYVDLSSIDNDIKQITDVKHVLGRDAPSRARQLIRKGDVLVSTVRPGLNGVAIVPEPLDGATASTGFTVLRANEVTLSGQFLFHWVRTSAFVSNMVRKATGQSYPAVSDRIILESAMPVPRIEEQRRIAAILDQAEALRARRRQALAKLDTLTQSLLEELLMESREQSMVKLKNICSRITDGVHQKPNYTESGIPFISVKNIAGGVIDFAEMNATPCSPKSSARGYCAPWFPSL